MSEKENNDIVRALGRIEGRVDDGFKHIDEHFRRLSDWINIHEQKIDKLEQWHSTHEGESKAIGFIPTIIGGVVGAIGVAASVFIAIKK
jgi:hypothetical protein